MLNEVQFEKYIREFEGLSDAKALHGGLYTCETEFFNCSFSPTSQ